MDKPAFDPSQPFEVSGKPAFDPSMPFDAAPSAPQVGMAEDAAKSVAAGLGNATIGTLGMAGDLTDLGAKGIEHASNYINDKLGLPRYERPTEPSILNKIPTSQSIRSTVTDPIVSPDYEPQTGLGSVLKTGAEFLPGMADPELAGPAAFKAAAKLFATRVAAPALTSEGAGALTKGTAAEPYARVAGALAGGAGAAKLANSMTEARALRAATPALADVKAEASNAYDALTSRNVATPIPQAALDNLASDITTTLNNKGIRPSTAQSIHNAVDEIKTPATAGAADVADLVAARQNVKSLLSAPDANKAGAFVALGKIENAIEQNSPGTMKAIREADKNYGAARAVEALDKKSASADLRAAATDSGMNVGNKIRQKVASLLESSEAKYLSAETKADLEKIVRGTATQQIIRKIDRVLGGGGGLGMMAGGIGSGYAADGWEGALLGAAGAHSLRTIYNRSVLKNAERAGQNIRMRSPLGQQTPFVPPPKTSVALSALLPALLARPKQ